MSNPLQFTPGQGSSTYTAAPPPPTWSPQDYQFAAEGIGSGFNFWGNVATTIGNFMGSRRAEADMRGDAAFARSQAQAGYQLAADQAQAGYSNAMTDIGLGASRARGSILAGGAASGVRGSSGSTQAIIGSVNQAADRARDRAGEQLDFAMRSAEMTRDQAFYNADELVEAADEERRNRGFRLFGDITNTITSTVQAAGQLMMMAGGG